MGQPTGMIFNIQRYSLHDGNGIRTNVFFKGCPLRCLWCSNPESQQYYPEMSFDAKNCMGCGHCYEICPTGALTPEKWDRAKCTGCAKCEMICPTGAREIMGKAMTVEEVVHAVMKDHPFYQTSGGGVTFSGGEPLTQSEFVEQLAIRLKDNFIHLAVETCGQFDWEQAKGALAHIDQILFDIKHMDSAQHKRLTGTGNELILENAEKAAKLGKEMIIRVPTIGGYNADDENIKRTAEFAKKIGVREMHLLPYHRFGEAKYTKMHVPYGCEDAYTLDDEAMDRLKELAQSQGLTVRVGG